MKLISAQFLMSYPLKIHPDTCFDSLRVFSRGFQIQQPRHLTGSSRGNHRYNYLPLVDASAPHLPPLSFFLT